MTRLAAAALGAAIASCGTPALAQQAPDPCPVTSPSTKSKLDFFAGISPADTPLDVWCRLQRLSGDFKFNILFGQDPAVLERQQKGVFMGEMFQGQPKASPNRTFDVRFDGKPAYGKQDFAMMLQSLLPTKPRTGSDPMGNAFGEVLSKVVEVRAAKTPDGAVLGLHPGYAGSTQLALWESLALRIKPIRHDGADFKLSVYFRPSVPQLFAGLDGAAEMMTLNGNKDDVLRSNGTTEGDCSEWVPDCVGRPDVVPLLTGWQFDRMVLESEDGQLSTAAQSLLGDMATSGKDYVKRSTMKQFTLSEGKAEVKLDDGAREVWGRAFPRNGKTGGTARIAVLYRERPNSKVTYDKLIKDYAKKFRDKVFAAYENAPAAKATPVSSGPN